MEESKDIPAPYRTARCAGWFSPAITNTLNTFELAAAGRLRLYSRPVPPTTSHSAQGETGRLLSMPYSST